MALCQINMLENSFVTLDVFRQSTHADQPFGFPDPDHFQQTGFPDNLLFFLIDEIKSCFADHGAKLRCLGENPFDFERSQTLKRFHYLIKIGINVRRIVTAMFQKIMQYILNLPTIRDGKVQQCHERFQFRRQNKM